MLNCFGISDTAMKISSASRGLEIMKYAIRQGRCRPPVSCWYQIYVDSGMPYIYMISYWKSGGLRGAVWIAKYLISGRRVALAKRRLSMMTGP